MMSTHSAEGCYQTLLYYKFVAVPNPELIRQEQVFLCNRLNLLGRIIVAAEGINGTVSGPADRTQCYRNFMHKHPLFANLEFKVDDTEGHTFRKLSVRVKNELVHLGASQALDPAQEAAPYLEPQEMQQLLRHPPENVVILDTRSKYEYEIGHFKQAVALDIENFRELPGHLNELEALRGKKIITYCTGGIRCEKVTALLHQHGFKDVYQLHGGILNYAKQTGGENFEGQCYVFDDRIKVAVNHVNPSIVGTCVHCQTPTEHMMNCANADCNSQMILCEACAEALQGCCSQACLSAPRRRVFNGKGQYHRGQNSKQYVGEASLAGIALNR